MTVYLLKRDSLLLLVSIAVYGFIDEIKAAFVLSAFAADS